MMNMTKMIRILIIGLLLLLMMMMMMMMMTMMMMMMMMTMMLMMMTMTMMTMMMMTMTVTWWEKVGKLVVLWIEAKPSKAETSEEGISKNNSNMNNIISILTATTTT